MKKVIFFILSACYTLLLHAQVTDGLIAYYPFNGNANDASGHNNNSTINSASLTADRFGNANSAYLFNGSNAYILIPNSSSLQSPGTTNAITQAAWIYINGMSLVGSSFNPITMKTDNGNNNFMYRMCMDFGSMTASYIDWNNYATSSYSFNLHTWYFLVTTYDGSVGKCYVNGNLIASTTLNLTIPTDNLPLTIGRDAPGAEEYFNGIIDDVRIYNRALTQAQIDSLAKDFPSASINNKSLNEGNTGSTIMNFKVSLNHASDTTIKIKYKTQDVTATAGIDYVAKQGILNFQPGQTSKNISITINGDVTNEPDERFRILLSNPVNVLLLKNTGTGTIKNDDAGFTQIKTGTAANISALQKITLSPNPAKNNIWFYGLKEENIAIEIIDLTGKTILKERLINNSVDVSALSAGSYIVRLNLRDKQEILKFVKL